MRNDCSYLIIKTSYTERLLDLYHKFLKNRYIYESQDYYPSIISIHSNIENATTIVYNMSKYNELENIIINHNSINVEHDDMYNSDSDSDSDSECENYTYDNKYMYNLEDDKNEYDYDNFEYNNTYNPILSDSIIFYRENINDNILQNSELTNKDIINIIDIIGTNGKHNFCAFLTMNTLYKKTIYTLNDKSVLLLEFDTESG